jgi:hypothetical protein
MEPTTSTHDLPPVLPPKKKKNRPSKKKRERFFKNVRPRQEPQLSRKQLRNIGANRAGRPEVPGVDFPIVYPTLQVAEQDFAESLRENIRDGRLRLKWLLRLYAYKHVYAPQLSFVEFDGRLKTRTPFDAEDKCWHRGEWDANLGGGRLNIYRLIVAAADMVRGQDVGRNFVEVSQMQWEHSHICHRSTCINPNHILKESRAVNNDREACRYAGACIRKHQPPCRPSTDAVYQSWIPAMNFNTNDELTKFCQQHLGTGCKHSNSNDDWRRATGAFLKIWRSDVEFVREMTLCRHIAMKDLKKGKCVSSCRPRRNFWTVADLTYHWNEKHKGAKLGVGQSKALLEAMQENDSLGPFELLPHQARTPNCIFDELHLENRDLLAWLKKHHCDCHRPLGAYRTTRFCDLVWWSLGDQE